MSIAVMKLALEALELTQREWVYGLYRDEKRQVLDAIEALHAAIEQAQEPVAEIVEDYFSKQVKGVGRWHSLPNGTKLYTAPQPQQPADPEVGLNGLTEAETSASASVMGLTDGRQRSERKAFEAWWRTRQLETFPKDYDESRLDNWGGAYKPDAWRAWQARADLAPPAWPAEPSRETLDRAAKFAIQRSSILSAEYGWRDYMRDLWKLMRDEAIRQQRSPRQMAASIREKLLDEYSTGLDSPPE